MDAEDLFVGYLKYLETLDQGHARGIYMRDSSLARLGQALKKARRELGFSRSETARLAGTTRQHVLDIEKGRDARLSSLLRLAQVYDCRVNAYVTFPEMKPLWKKANLRREEERKERLRERFFRRMRRKRPELFQPSPARSM